MNDLINWILEEGRTAMTWARSCKGSASDLSRRESALAGPDLTMLTIDPTAAVLKFRCGGATRA